MPKSELSSYILQIALSLKYATRDIKAAEEEIRETKKRGARVWMLGNGGSLAIAQHFAQDLLKMHGIRAQCLNDPSVITAYTNDEGFDKSFFSPLSKLIDPDDLIFAFSCSGKSPNYSLLFNDAQVKCVKNRKIAVVGTDGGFMKKHATVNIHIKSDDYRICESAFNIVADLINIGLED